MRNDKGQFVKGHKHTEEVKNKISSIHKGKPAKWILSDNRKEICDKISKVKKGIPNLKAKGELNYGWKGDEVGYMALHAWISRTYGKPKFCEHCGTTKRKMYHWAMVSNLYTRDRSGWLRLCVPCHKKYDLNRYA